MYQTLEDIEIQFEYEKLRAPKCSLQTFFRETKVLLIIFISIFLGMYLITNAQLIIDNFYDHFSPTQVQSFSTETISSSANVLKDTQKKAEAVEELIQTYSGIISLEKEMASTVDQFLRNNLASYDFDFNVLPPTNRLVISTINLDVPLIQMKIKDYEEFSAGSFDTELENGVVKYPTTPNPGE
ncbi:MAG: hypothetical protein LBD75_03555 [Candidatus Peribacteria bacterium]|jgi:hypothetical protein|nr:hypothetical protein [Candidatus Peribacteria bacterium]